ncbi:OmpA family protein [Desulfurobacterium atlanticum]|uniref:OmpA family protein n=1 Tax=Desulfurobacterium atlanticum TaxID=240169 RepID=A0A239A1U4_9BACT|nr:OmpA family protein [Desulfurobacterium atlanticum]SNR89372.1 OmpA family protein [Desulfurobacterium atlanticum]
MRIKILPLLFVVSTAVSISGCVKQTETVIPAKPEKYQTEVKKENVAPEKPLEKKQLVKSKKPAEPLTVKVLKNSIHQSPKFKLTDYVLKKEVENFKKETGVEVVPVYPMFPVEIKNRKFVLFEEPDKVRIVVKDSYIFEINRENIKNTKLLDSLAKNFGKYLIVIATYFDNSGSAQFNSYITEKRAEVIRSYLQRLGISSGNILAKGCGDKNPIAPNSSVEGRALNRRVEFYIYPPEAIVDRVCEAR